MIREESRGSRGQSPIVYQDIPRCRWERTGCSSGVCPSGRNIWERALVRPQGSRQAAQPPTPPQSTSQVHPGRAAHDPARRTNERVRACTGAGDLRLRTTVIHSENRKRMQQQAKGATQQPLLWGADMQCGQESASAWPDNGRPELAGPTRRTSGQDHHTGRHPCSQKRSRGLDVVDRWIALRWWLSGSRSGVWTRKWLGVSQQLSGHQTYGSLRCRTVGNRSRAWCGNREERYIAGARSEDGGSLQWLTRYNSTSGTPGSGPSAATGEADQQNGADSPRPQHRDRDPLSPGTLRHSRKRRIRPPGQFGPRPKRKHSDRAAVHPGVEQG